MSKSKFEDFRIGTRVRVDTNHEDFYFFNKTETGVVIRNHYGYLGIIVKFDKPRHFENGCIQTEFNFNPESLIVLEAVEQRDKFSDLRSFERSVNYG